MARPQKPDIETRKKLLQVRLLQGEYDVFKQAAESAGLDLSAWVRERLRQAARRDLKAARDDPNYMEVD